MWWPQRGAQGLSLCPMCEPFVLHRAVPVTLSEEVTLSPSANHGQTSGTSIPHASRDPDPLQRVQRRLGAEAAVPGTAVSMGVAKRDEKVVGFFSS